MLITRLATRFGIGGKALAWFKSYLSSRSQFVRIDDSTSKSYDLLCGVPQGSILGPLLYSLYTAPLADIARRHNLDFHFYADDSQLYVVFDPSCAWDTETAKCKIEACVLEMYSWLLSNRSAKLNSLLSVLGFALVQPLTQFSFRTNSYIRLLMSVTLAYYSLKGFHLINISHLRVKRPSTI